ncbi:serine O-acetyltransferase [Arthrobacter luteolus]|uniref:serine O-acetyltransferase n=1 Tax=Arthrobacter luteolus TaxID=98672 RepID=UPI00384D8BB9
MSVVTAEIHDFTLTTTVNRSARDYAFSLYLNGEVIEKQHYKEDNTHRFDLRRPGVYRVRGYARDSLGRSEAWPSEPVRFAGFPDVPASPSSAGFLILGVTGASAVAAYILSQRNEVLGFLDTTEKYRGTSFIGYPVFGSVPPGSRTIGHENYLPDFPGTEAFTLMDGTSDILSRELHRSTAIELYRMARKAHLEGLVMAANHIQNFIFTKFNSRIPYTAEIGDGSRFGYNGIGLVIHKSAKIGKNCVIGQNVTLGARSGGNGHPIVGDNVYISPGAICLGGRIGNNVVVGANAVVIDEVQDNCVVAGVPARVISKDMSKYDSYVAGH